MKRKLIAFREKDHEGDIWSERVFLFETHEQVRDFFRADNPDLLSVYTDEPEEGEEKQELHKFRVFDNNPAKLINAVHFFCENSGDVRIYKMAEGFLIS